MGKELSGKTAIVTGGAAGIGRATVERLLQDDARVVIADIDADRGEAAATQLGPDVAFKATDVASANQMSSLVSFAVETFGGLHVMVNNAGVPTAMHARLLDDDLGDFQRVVDVDLLGVMLGTQHAARHMAASGGGSIINLTSIAGIHAGRGEMTYRAVKAGVAHFTKCAAIDLGEDGIRVNCIAPGAIPTQMLSTATEHVSHDDGLTADLRAMMTSMRPLSRDGAVTDIAHAIAYFAGDQSGYVTGTVLPVDGGIVAGDNSRALVDILEKHGD